LWIEAVAELEGAKARVAALMQTTPCEYLIFSQKASHKISIKPTNGSWSYEFKITGSHSQSPHVRAVVAKAFSFWLAQRLTVKFAWFFS